MALRAQRFFHFLRGSLCILGALRVETSCLLLGQNRSTHGRSSNSHVHALRGCCTTCQ
jgi:hypothetical protein